MVTWDQIRAFLKEQGWQAEVHARDARSGGVQWAQRAAKLGGKFPFMAVDLDFIDDVEDFRKQVAWMADGDFDPATGRFQSEDRSVQAAE